MTIQRALLTAEDIYEMRLPEGRSELIDGVLVEMGPEAFESGEIALEIGARIREYIRPLKLGRVVGGDVGFVLQRNPDRVRAPDIGFVSVQRLPIGERLDHFFEGAPDLVVEVVSPSDKANDVQAKALEWLGAGASLVWVVFPETRTVMVYAPNQGVKLIDENDRLSAAPVLPGFSIIVRDLFA